MSLSLGGGVNVTACDAVGPEGCADRSVGLVSSMSGPNYDWSDEDWCGPENPAGSMSGACGWSCCDESNYACSDDSSVKVESGPGSDRSVAVGSCVLCACPESCDCPAIVINFDDLGLCIRCVLALVSGSAHVFDVGHVRCVLAVCGPEMLIATESLHCFDGSVGTNPDSELVCMC